jgi:hypothetical protein
MTMFPVPLEVEAVFKEFRTCEFTTLANDGTPLTWPTTSVFEPEKGCFLITTSIGFPQKVFNIRRNSRVSLLFSDPIGSGLSTPPAVLVQGDARVSEEVVTSPANNEDLRKCWLHIMRLQSFSFVYRNYPLTHYTFDWYFMRLLITVTPCSICWWEQGNFARVPQALKVSHVG